MNYDPISPSQIAAQSLGLAVPALPLSPTSCSCGLCGQSICEGITPATAYKPPMDFASEQIHPLRAATICQSCAALLACPTVLTKFSRAVFTSTGAYRLTTAQDVAWLLMHAPAPLVAVFNTRKAAHMVWHTPVTYDKRAIGMTWAKTSGVIRTARVQAAYEALARLSQHYNARTKARFSWPVDGLTLRDDNTHMCQLLPSHDHLLRRSADLTVRDDLEAFDCLNQCERWALSAVLLTSPSVSTTWTNLVYQTPPLLTP